MSVMPPPRSPATTPRPQARPYQEYMAQHRIFLAACRTNLNKDLTSGQQLWRQMMVGFTCAGIVGLIMLIVGTVFIAEAVRKEQPITVMLCVMGIVFGTIILVGTIILDRHLISRKWMKCHGEDNIPASQCFHTCSVIYSPSLDQIGPNESAPEPPPAYESVVSIMLHPLHAEAGVVEVHAQQEEQEEETSVMILPPKYEDAMQPLPDYCEGHSERSAQGVISTCSE